jgi:hypothetical protein
VNAAQELFVAGEIGGLHAVFRHPRGDVRIDEVGDAQRARGTGGLADRATPAAGGGGYELGVGGESAFDALTLEMRRGEGANGAVGTSNGRRQDEQRGESHCRADLHDPPIVAL